MPLRDRAGWQARQRRLKQRIATGWARLGRKPIAIQDWLERERARGR